MQSLDRALGLLGAADGPAAILEHLRAGVELYENTTGFLHPTDPRIIEENEQYLVQVARDLEAGLADESVCAYAGVTGPAFLAYRYVPSKGLTAPRLEGVGTHWTIDPGLHQTLSGKDLTSLRGKPWQLTAVIPLDSIDWRETWSNRISYPTENEVTVRHGAQVVLVGFTNDPSQRREIEPQTITAAAEMPQVEVPVEPLTRTAGNFELIAAALDRAVYRYVSPTQGKLTPAQLIVRRISYALRTVSPATPR